MNKSIGILSLFVFICLYAQVSYAQSMESYNIVWNSQSNDSSESMPVGGCDVGLNVWVENGDLLFYIAQSGTFDENNQMLKHGRVRMSFSPNPFDDADMFCQTLRVDEGDIVIEGRNSKNDIHINVWVDAFKPVVNVDTKASKPLKVIAQYESWRTVDRLMPFNAKSACMSYLDYLGDVVTYKDEIEVDQESISWYHRNRPDKLVRDFCIEQQGIEQYRDSIPDTQTNLTFGGAMSGTDMRYAGRTKGKYIDTEYVGFKLKSKRAVCENSLQIALAVGQYSSLDKWQESLDLLSHTAQNDSTAKAKAEEWWADFWDRSYIMINSDDCDPQDKAWQVGRNYQLFRYMLGCNAKGGYPSKFNGSLFTYDPRGIVDKYSDFTPDFRAWGGGSFTAQNQRLVYWPMLKTGDFDMMPAQFNFYSRTLSAAEARSRLYWGHDGACYVEQLENFGLPYAAGWGFDAGLRKRSDDVEWGVQDNKWIIYHYINQLEFSLMIMDYFRFSGVDISEYIPFIESSIKFFDEHYKYRNKQLTGQELSDDGKLVIYPSTAAEMYKIAKNPTDIISALRCVVTRVSELPTRYISIDKKADYLDLLQRIPELSYEEKPGGHKVIKPAESWEYVANQEIPELYVLFPYGVYGLTKPDLDIAKNTWEYGESNAKRAFTECWSQVGIFAARLGLVDEASELIVDKMSDAARRFPTFWGPGPDWVPDVDHGGSAMVALQEMLMQTDGDNILLFGAWNKDWDVKFKMHAPHNTTVEVELKDGEVAILNVYPKSRRDDVIIML